MVLTNSTTRAKHQHNNRKQRYVYKAALTKKRNRIKKLGLLGSKQTYKP